MTKIIHENHTECPSCKNITLPPITGGNAVTCTNPDCLAIIDIYLKIIGRIEDGVAVYKEMKLDPAVKLKLGPKENKFTIELNLSEIFAILFLLRTEEKRGLSTINDRLTKKFSDTVFKR